jgi:2-phosphoglycerate kinase
MHQSLAAMTVVGIIAYGIVTIIKLITEYKLKRRLIDKAEVSEGLSTALEESMKSIAPKYEQLRYPTLKW